MPVSYSFNVGIRMCEALLYIYVLVCENSSLAKSLNEPLPSVDIDLEMFFKFRRGL
jgi:hypothetical protein